MTTRELIAELQRQDPSGDVPVVVDNKEVYTVECMAAYWDGVAQLHVVDEAAKPYWHIKGMRVTTKGHKVRLSTIGVEDFIENIPDGLVEFDFSYSDDAQRAEIIREWQSRVETWRAEVKQIIADIATRRRA